MREQRCGYPLSPWQTQHYGYVKRMQRRHLRDGGVHLLVGVSSTRTAVGVAGVPVKYSSLRMQKY